MRVVLQRVKGASVEVDGEKVSGIGPGLLLLVGVTCLTYYGLEDDYLVHGLAGSAPAAIRSGRRTGKFIGTFGTSGTSGF